MLRRKASEAKGLVKNKAKQYIDSLDCPVLDPPQEQLKLGATSPDILSPAISPCSSAPYQAILESLDEMQNFVQQFKVSESASECAHAAGTKEAGSRSSAAAHIKETTLIDLEPPTEPTTPPARPERKDALANELELHLETATLSSSCSPGSLNSPQRGVIRESYDSRSANSTASAPASFPMVDIAYFRKLPPLLVDLGTAPEPPGPAPAIHVESQLESLHWKRPHKDREVEDLQPPAKAAAQGLGEPKALLRDPREIRREASRDPQPQAAPPAAKNMPQPIPKPVTLAQDPMSIVSPVRLLDQPSIAQLVDAKRSERGEPQGSKAAEPKAANVAAPPKKAPARTPTTPLSVQTRVTPAVPSQAAARTPTRAIPTSAPARPPARVTPKGHAVRATASTVKAATTSTTFYGRFPF